jgi:hypothetical protein
MLTPVLLCNAAVEPVCRGAWGGLGMRLSHPVPLSSTLQEQQQQQQQQPA